MFESRVLIEALLVEKAINAELRASIARSNANFDWLAATVNELKVERAALLERLLGLQLAGVPSIQRTETPLPGADPNYVPASGKIVGIGDILNRAREITEVAKRGGAPEPSIATPDGGELSFEDMGDDAAQAAGVRHTRDGTVMFTR